MELSRREFCQTVAAAGAGLAAVHPALGQVKADQAEKKKGVSEPRRIPVGCPCRSFSIHTFSTRSGVSRVMPRAASPAVFRAQTFGITGAQACIITG